MWLDPKLAQRCGQFGRSQALIELRVELLDNRHGDSYWTEETQPRIWVEADLRVSAFSHGGDTRQMRGTSGAGKCQRLRFAVFDQRENIAQGREIDVDPST